MATINSIHLVVDESVSIGRAGAGDATLRQPPSNESVAGPFALFADEDRYIVFGMASPTGEMCETGEEAPGATATLTVKLGRLVTAVLVEATMELGSIEITLEGIVTASAVDTAEDDDVTDAVDDIADGAEVAVMTSPPAESRGHVDDNEIGVNELFP